MLAKGDKRREDVLQGRLYIRMRSRLILFNHTYPGIQRQTCKKSTDYASNNIDHSRCIAEMLPQQK